MGVRSKKYMEGVLERRVARNILIPNANASPISFMPRVPLGQEEFEKPCLV